jgi:hypothetical protein
MLINRLEADNIKLTGQAVSQQTQNEYPCYLIYTTVSLVKNEPLYQCTFRNTASNSTTYLRCDVVP